MPGSRVYPDEPAGPFPSPPATIEDRDGRQIDLRAPTAFDAELTDALVRMYDRFDPADRAQGIPPTGEKRIRPWIDSIVAESVNVLASHDADVVGHATLVPDADEPGAIEWELAIFVLQDYQRVGIGTQLLEHLLGHASDRGIERVWLTVERWNEPAMALYERVGFETSGSESFELEMSILLE